jgi:hypothetical protein
MDNLFWNDGSWGGSRLLAMSPEEVIMKFTLYGPRFTASCFSDCIENGNIKPAGCTYCWLPHVKTIHKSVIELQSRSRVNSPSACGSGSPRAPIRKSPRLFSNKCSVRAGSPVGAVPTVIVG